MLPLIGFLTAVLLQPKHLKGELPIDAYLKTGFSVGILCALGGVTLIWLWEFQSRAARRRNMRQLAAELSRSYTEEMAIPPDLLTDPLFVEFGQAYPTVQNVIHGQAGDRYAWVLDYRHPEYLTSGGGTHATQVWKSFDTVIAIRGVDDKPHLSRYRYGSAIHEIRRDLNQRP